MKKGILFAPLILLLLAAFLITACGSTAGPEALAVPPQEEPAAPVEVADVETGQITLVYSYAGDLQSKSDVDIIPGASGRVTSLLVEVGDEVKAGDPLAMIDQDRYRAQLKQAEAGFKTARLNLDKMQQGRRPEEIAAAQAAVQLARASVNDVATIDDDERTRAASALAQAQAALGTAQAEYDKVAWAGDVGRTPQAMALEQATIAYETALANYNIGTNPSDAQLAPLMAQLTQAELALALATRPFQDVDFQIARTAVEQAEAAVELARIQMDETTIEAPFDGVVAELYISEGSMIGPQASIASFVTREVEVVFDVEENRVGQMFKGQNAALRVTAYPGQDFPAVVTNVAPVADKNTHTFAVKVTPLDEEGLLRSGMYANLSILAQEKDDAILAPRAAVILLNDQETVYVLKEDNTVERREVITGIVNTDYVEILSGLKPGETVIIAGQPNLTDGAPVEIMEES